MRDAKEREQNRILRHPNGGALKIGTEVHVSADSFCDSESQLSGNTHVIESSIRGSNLFATNAFQSTAGNCVGIGSIWASVDLYRVYSEGTVLDRVRAEGAPGGELRLIEVIAERCELYGNWELSGNGRIPTGIWHRAPRFLRITGENGVDFGLTESTDGHAMLGCWRKPLTELLKAGPRLGNKHGWTGEQIMAAKLFYESLLDEPMEA